MEQLRVSISRRDAGRWVWAGAGVLDGNRITDCAADLGDDVYDALDAAIDGDGEYRVAVNGAEYRATVERP